MGSNVMNLKRAAELCAREFTILYASDNEETIWVRTRTQAETESALEATADQRLAIRKKYTKGSSFHQLLVAGLDLYTNAELAAVAVQTEYQDIARKASSKPDKLLPLDASKYSTKTALAKAEEAYEERKAVYDKELNDAIIVVTEERKAKLAEEPRDTLVDMVVRMQVQMAISEDNQRLMEDYTIWDCVRTAEDHSARYFDTVDEIPSVPQIRDMLLNCIEIVDSIEPAAIKN